MIIMRKMDKAKHNNNVTYRCHYHVVWQEIGGLVLGALLHPVLETVPINS